MNIYPEQLRQILAYIAALDDAEKMIGNDIDDGMTVQLLITVTDEDGGRVLGTIVDEVGGAWSFAGAS